MVELIRKVIYGYNLIFVDLADPRTKTWPLVAKPYQGLTILALYLMFVLKWGPWIMKNRQPFNMDKILIMYNAIQVICCGMLGIMAIIEAWGWKYKWICEPVDTSESRHAITIAKYVYFYYLLKISDLADTIFFVLRKKHGHLSFLHIYHHTGMVALSWGGVTYAPGGHGTSVGVINCYVHCIMYSYYLLSVISPSIKNSIRFKKFVTQIQIIQFFLLTLHFVLQILTPDCSYPKWIAAVFLPQNIFMLILFLNFYIKTYTRKPKQCPNDDDTDGNEKMAISYAIIKDGEAYEDHQNTSKPYSGEANRVLDLLINKNSITNLTKHKRA